MTCTRVSATLTPIVPGHESSQIDEMMSRDDVVTV